MLPQLLDVELKVRQEEIERQLRQGALLRALRAGQPPKVSTWRRVGCWVGVCLVRIGTRLESFDTERTPSLVPEVVHND